MARPGILYSDVARAAAKLAAAGTNPTVDGVREALGATGSKSTIAPLLKRWKSEQQGTVAAAKAGLPPSLVQAVKDLHEHMQSEFAQHLDQAQQVHDDALRAAAEQEEKLRTENEAVRKTHAALAADLAHARQALAQLQESHHAQSVALSTAEVNNAGLQQRLADRATEIETLARQLSQARTQFEHYQEATAAQRAEERQGYEQRTTRLEQDLAGTQRHIAAQQATIAQQEATITHLTTEQRRHEQALRAAQADLAAACTARDRLSRHQENETAAKERAEALLNRVQQQLTDVRAELAAKTCEAALLAEQLRRAEERAGQLVEEKATWLQERGALMQRAQAVEQQAAALTGSATNA